jgi:predicted dehydrogenase
MTAKVRIGFVGTGTMGQAAHLANYVRLTDDVEVVALAEARPNLAAAVARRYGIPGVYADADAMIAAEQLDALVAPQQFTRHLQVVGPLYRHGLPILTEKPLAMSTAVARELIRMLDDSPTPFHMVGFHKRSDPAVREAKRVVDELLQSGRWGELRSARMTMAGDDWTLGAFDDVLLSDEPMPQGELDAAADDAYVSFINYYVHQTNLLRYLAGPYRVDFADPAGRLLVGATSGGASVVLEMGPSGEPGWDESIVLGFDGGWVKVTLPAPLAARQPGVLEVRGDFGDGVATRTPYLPPKHAMLAQAAAFVAAVRGEEPPPSDAHDALEDQLVADAYFAALGRHR